MTMRLTPRWYRDATDLARMLDLVRAGAVGGARHTYYQVGDVLWRMYQHPLDVWDPHTRLVLWEDAAGALMAFADLDVDLGSMTLQLHPALRAAPDAADTLDALLAWAESQPEELDLPAGAVPSTYPSFQLYAREDDALYLAALARRGYAREDPDLLAFQRPLAGLEPAAALPAGWAIRSMAELSAPDDLARRVELHREVWAPSRVTLEAYQRLRQAEGYRPDLDLVAVGPDGVFGAYCICWADEANHSGEFEPVGVRRECRRLGLARAVLQEGCQRLRAGGASLAIVYTGAADSLPKFEAVPARRLYLSAGFTLVNALVTYRLERGPASPAFAQW
ncbi:MAG TPA: GNAT family N-acetyltransferase [Ktedonobacterales bacterium]|nr:GNAT family N-acetyltransferase [Ktedonobacterales bacterium]